MPTRPAGRGAGADNGQDGMSLQEGGASSSTAGQKKQRLAPSEVIAERRNLNSSRRAPAATGAKPQIVQFLILVGAVFPRHEHFRNLEKFVFFHRDRC